ncbi:hypothetical protein ACGFI3_20470 [Nonomuraea wenchangensis]|uniref:hypothetical protein n=1 Tax=Nonomuraea wenchangensis TaxID=568860 RepID=UPI00371DBA16
MKLEQTYADTKLCNLLTVPPFAERRRDRGITIDAVHPGVIRTGLGDRSAAPWRRASCPTASGAP